MTVSIIVPMYYGKKYLNRILEQVDICARSAEGIGTELILYNDSPDEGLYVNTSGYACDIKVFNPEFHNGIHGARICALEEASGDYIIFLDQDDKIKADYIHKQLTAIGNADAVVCQAVQGHKKLYQDNKILEKCIQKDYMIWKGNRIVSPGQVLIKKTAISEFWKTNILKYNGADDWFLWICMLCEGKSFKANQEILFEHTIHTENTSANGFSMLSSMHEVYEKLKENKDCKELELNGIYHIIKEHATKYIRERDKFLKFYYLLSDWMELWEGGITIADYIRGEGHTKVSIYGKGRIGLHLAKELQCHQIEVCYFIDRDAEAMQGDIRTILPEKLEKIQEPVIITLEKSEAEVVGQTLQAKGVKQIYILSDLIRYCGFE